MKRILLICAAALLVLAAAALIVLDLPSFPPLELDRITSAAASTVLYDARGEELNGLYSGRERVWAPLSALPEHLPQAFIAAEDARFYSHPGVDVRRIFGALLSNIRTLSFSEGASTITQQLVRMTHLSAEKTLTRKAQEAVLALRLEREMDKSSILEYYLNIAYFGSGAYGVGSAAQAYFSKSASDLTLAESALLAGLVKAPSSYAPDENPQKALDRRSYVLSAMLKNGFISQEEHDLAQAEPLSLRLSAQQQSSFGWYVDAAMEEAMSLLHISAEALLSGGYHIHTSLDPSLQTEADSLFADPSRFPADSADGTKAQAALAAVDPSTGEVLALVGGRSYTTRRGLDRASSIFRQPGSAFKPVSVYAAAVDSLRFVPTSIVLDQQRDFGSGYSPANAGGKYYGAVTLRTALSKSLNVASVDLLTRVGISSAREYARRLGIPLTKTDSGLSLALGSLTEGVSPLQLCSAYAALANSGAYLPAHIVRRIESSSGELLYEYQAEPVQAMRPESASLLTSMLETAVESGSAKALQSVGFPVAAKTGTVAMEEQGNRDAWIAAYTPSVAVCVWMGFDEPDAQHCLPEGSGGSAYPARLAAAFLSACAGRASSGPFPLAAGLSQVAIDQTALDQLGLVMLPCEYTPPSAQAQELFFTGEEPTMVSNIWHAPSMVWDLTASRQDGYPVLEFTAEAGAGYRVWRETQGERVCIAELVSPSADIVQIVDGTADPSLAHSYTVEPYHAALAEEQIDLTGGECLPVLCEPESGLWQRLFPQPTRAPFSAQEEPLFTGPSQ